MEKNKNQEYWEKRIANKIWKIYNSMEMKNKALIEFYLEASKEIRMELYELAEKIGEDGIISRTEMYTQQRLQKLEKRYREIAYELGRQIEDIETENMQQSFQEIYEITTEAIEKPDFALPDKNLMEELLKESWRGSNFSSRLWDNQKKLTAALHAVLTTGLQQGKSVINMAKELNMVMGKGLNAAHRLVRTETMHYLNQSVLQGYRDAEIKNVQFLAAKDERTCEICGAMHGNVYEIEKAPILPLHPNCRCTYLPVMENLVEKNRDDAIIKLPRYQETVIPIEKFTQYALNPEKDINKAKAFEKALGYTKENAEELIQQIRKKLPDSEAVEKGDRGWGMTYQVIMEIEGLNGKTAKVLTAWIDDKITGEMRLTTVHID